MSIDEFPGHIRERIIRQFLDVLILGVLNKSRCPLGAYNIIALVHREFNILLSSGTVYTLIYRMEREGFIYGIGGKRKTVYMLTEKGQEAIKALLDERNGIINLMEKLLMKD